MLISPLPESHQTQNKVPPTQDGSSPPGCQHPGGLPEWADSHEWALLKCIVELVMTPVLDMFTIDVIDKC